MAKLHIEATIPRKEGQSLEDGLPLLLQMMQAAGFTNIKVSTEVQLPETYEAPRERASAATRRLQGQVADIADAVAELGEDVRWIKETFVGAEDDAPSDDKGK